MRFGQRGFQDNQSPGNEIGGGQLALDIKPRRFPVAFSISSEYYTNSSEPPNSYKIESLLSLNICMIRMLRKYQSLIISSVAVLGELKSLEMKAPRAYRVTL